MSDFDNLFDTSKIVDAFKDISNPSTPGDVFKDTLDPFGKIDFNRYNTPTETNIEKISLYTKSAVIELQQTNLKLKQTNLELQEANKTIDSLKALLEDEKNARIEADKENAKECKWNKKASILSIVIALIALGLQAFNVSIPEAISGINNLIS